MERLSVTRRIFFLAIVVVLLLPAGESGLIAQTTSRSYISRLNLAARQMKSRLVSIRSEIKNKQSALNQVKQKEKTAIGRLELTETRLDIAQSRVTAVKLRLLANQEQLRHTTERLRRTERQLARRKRLLSSRIVDIYEGESLSYANVLLGSTDMWTFLTRAYDVKRVVGSDVELIEGIKKDQEQIEKDRAEQQLRVAQAQALQERFEEDRDEVAGLVAERQKSLNEIQSDRQALEEALNKLERDSNQIEREIQARMRAGSRSGTFTGSLNLPVIGRLTSGFGYRLHPILGKVRLHTGVDIAAPSGTEITAAAAGEVIMSGWRGGYGKTIVIDHGGGVCTLYGHCSSLLVSIGQKVTKGQTIARVGSTGLSTGPHCHFEKRIDGKPVNPL